MGRLGTLPPHITYALHILASFTGLLLLSSGSSLCFTLSPLPLRHQSISDLPIKKVIFMPKKREIDDNGTVQYQVNHLLKKAIVVIGRRQGMLWQGRQTKAYWLSWLSALHMPDTRLLTMTPVSNRTGMPFVCI